MLRTVFQSTTPPLTWLDLAEPSRHDLEEIARRYGFPETAVQDCLDPEHLPKLERFESARGFAILRGHDEKAPPDADTIQALTRKIAIFWGEDFLITIHRKDQPYLQTVLTQASRLQPAERIEAAALIARLLVMLAGAVIESYEVPLEDAEMRMDAIEIKLLGHSNITLQLQDMYTIKRRISLAKRLLWRTITVTHRLPLGADRASPLLQDLRENAESMHFYADELLEDVNNLLSMQLSLAAHRTNEVIQVLTIFSAFFLPLTFIVGIYGMNFAHMPELATTWGYPAVLLLMLTVSGAIYAWFRKRGWL
ncbi:MAG TPA: CorA family divalent cation transporter [Gemmatimonadales bacterium]|nr:CorA family divalent cation transporter [Gemmatimonadales bacterium]